MVRVPTKVYFVGSSLTVCILVHVRAFSCIKKDLRKARKRVLATFDGNRRAVGMLNAMRDKNNEGTYRGGEWTAPTYL